MPSQQHAAAPLRLRAAILTATTPSRTGDGDVQLRDDAVIELQEGRIVAIRSPRANDPSPSGLLLLPGFVDLHCHWPQSHVRGKFSGALLPWLRESIWPAEATFAQQAEAERRATDFIADLIGAGTTAGLFFGPPFLAASQTFLAAAPHGMFDGPAIMEINCPDDLQTPATEMLTAIAALPDSERRRLTITPRFAPNLTAAGLAQCGETAKSLGLLAQSHLSENLDEIAWVRALYPERTSYTDIYDKAGLLGDHVVMAHGIHLDDAELLRLAQTGTLIAHCPTSNEALSSGRMPLERLRDAGVDWVLATDVGAGPQLSQLHVMASFLAQHEAAHVAVTAVEAFIRSTQHPGAWLARQDPTLQGLGTLSPGAPGHMVAFARPPGQDAETILRNLLETAGPNYEKAAEAVWCWGAAYKLPSSRALSGPTSAPVSVSAPSSRKN